RQEDDAVVFAVADRGPGIPPEDGDRIFEPFFRGDRTADGDGTGLGLNIARRLARAQGGDVRYQPRPGGGSVFSLSLPLADAAAIPG
ncbi:MAG TPA: sensor histidine kinase, partial [Longimicrobiales bacterium]